MPARLYNVFMAFEVFQRKRRAYAMRAPFLSVSSDGRSLVFNASAARMISDVRDALLMFDAESRSLALAPTSEGNPDGYAVSHVPSAASISCRAFISRWDLERGGRWELVHKDGLFSAIVK